RAQSLSQTDLVAGQFARLEVTGAAPSDSVAFLWSFVGTGAGPCYPDVGVCLDLVQPALLAIVSADATGTAAIEGFVPEGVALVPVATQAVVVAAAGPPFPKTNTVAAAFLPLGHFDDEFDGGALGAEWQVLHPELATVTVGNGALEIVPSAGGLSNI